ncbi:TMV resistance protein N-like isoform X3 [Vigna unguiculata]|uniref:TMV resistance protein N-like isoform X3 n=1 Tax=Vigna unguiculata TaxID=3917 RepID=UPI0010161A88|nr:TMV resistance protein N-like isoform X3 [Vigna unguiculata]
MDISMHILNCSWTFLQRMCRVYLINTTTMMMMMTDKLGFRRFWGGLGLPSSSSNVISSESASSSDHSSGTIQNQDYRYDVFISFRGSDTRNSFVDHLYSHLLRKGIFVFKDDHKLRKGESISSQLLQAIRGSRISIIVFSKDYPSSSWCLDEMATIADCKQQSNQTVFPVFYDVDPSIVRHQRGAYKIDFLVHRLKLRNEPNKVLRWEKAMTDLANSTGWDVRYKPEFREIEKIVQAVIETLGHKFSGFVDDLIGIQPRVQALEDKLRLSSKSDDVQVLGIWGMGGIGKTTHAVVLYDKMSHRFDASCFIEDVSKLYRDGGHTAVQKQIIHQTLDEKCLDTYSPIEISGIVRNRLHKIKVLIVLDNVDELEQLQELAINSKLLFRGSRMVIISRDEHILKVYGAHVIHEVSLMNDKDARELFYTKAFESEEQNSSSCVELIPEVLKYAQCLPLAVRVIGSFLCRRDSSEWRDTLDRFENNPDNKIMDVLQISFDGLHYTEKEIFLHIACFFKEEREDYVKRILECCGLHPHIGIQRMIEKSLITIRDQQIHMHDMLQELGKKIVRNQCPEEPESWSRIWLYEDFFHVLTTQTGTNDVKAIVLNEKEAISECSIDGLSKMKNLKLLILYHKRFSGSLNFLSQKLRYFLWHDYPFASLPSSFAASGLVELNMPNSSINCLWEGRKDFPCLKRMDLSNSKYLTETPDFTGVPNLERLDLSGCTDLSFVHPSIGLLQQLAFLSLRNCTNLISFKLGNGFNLSSLRVLHFSGCTKLENTPDFTGTTILEYLDFDGCTSLSSVHESIGVLAKLTFLSLRDCTSLASIPSNNNIMKSLQTLDFSGCFQLTDLSLRFFISLSMTSLILLDIGFCNLLEVPNAIGDLLCLERLNLQGNNFVAIPPSISRLKSLAYLNVSHCHTLQYLPNLSKISTSSTGRYFKTVSGSRDHRSGLYLFDCTMITNYFYPKARFKDLELAWLVRLAKNPCSFRCGFDIVVPWGLEFPRSSSHPFYLSFESEDTEEYFDMPLNLERDKVVDSSKHLWIIYISREHCHFVKTGSHISFKAHPSVKINAWGMRSIFREDVIYSELMLEEPRHVKFDFVEKSSTNSGPKFQLPYNWLVTNEDEVENIDAKAKENNLSYAGL